MAALYTLWLVAVHATLVTQLSNAVTIVRVDVPAVVTLNAQPAVVLDCIYNLNDTAGLVVKWFFNKSINPVYQWIPPRKPQDLGALKGKLDFEYKVSDSPLQSQRALRVISPGVDLSGNYTCVVSTFQSEDRLTKPMLIFSPGHKLEFNYIRQESDDTVRLVCSVEDVYPQPIITIKRLSEPLPNQKIQVDPKEDGLFDLMVVTQANNSELRTKEEFVCELHIPQANFTASQFIMYNSRPENSTSEPTIVDDTTISEETTDTASRSWSLRPASTPLVNTCIQLIVTYVAIVFVTL